MSSHQRIGLTLLAAAVAIGASCAPAPEPVPAPPQDLTTSTPAALAVAPGDPSTTTTTTTTTAPPEEARDVAVDPAVATAPDGPSTTDAGDAADDVPSAAPADALPTAVEPLPPGPVGSALRSTGPIDAGPPVTARQSTSAPVVLERGHVDLIEVSVDAGALRLQVKDDTSGTGPVFRSPELVQLRVLDAARASVPSARFDFLGAVGTEVYLLPQVQNPDLVWPGWSTERIPSGTVAGDAVTVRLVDVAGPGSVAVFTTDQFGTPQVLFDGTGPAPDRMVVPIHTHAHANWAFTVAGTYQLTFEASATIAGAATSTRATYVVLVGEGTRPPVPGAVAPPTVTTGRPDPLIDAGGVADSSAAVGASGDEASVGHRSSGPGALASTGSDPVALTAAGTAAVLCGLALRLRSRRRRGVAGRCR